jgi:hypothetical protein
MVSGWMGLCRGNRSRYQEGRNNQLSHMDKL